MKERYDIKGKIGQGGIGAVYRAFDRRLNRDVAIKRVLPQGGFENKEEAVAHLLKEAKSLSSVQHPHIVTVYDAGVDEEGPYVVMVLLAGQQADDASKADEIRGFVRSIDLIANLPWETAYPEDNNVKQLVRRVRRAFERAGLENPVESRHGFGYRLGLPAKIQEE